MKRNLNTTNNNQTSHLNVKRREEEHGASKLWGEIIDRKLFDAELSIKASMADEGEIFCWP